MPFPLHKSPRGLLELFRLRTLGKQPEQFGESVVPVSDVTDFYGADLQGVGQSSFTSGSFPFASNVFTEERVTRYLCVQGGVTMGAAGGTWLKMTLSYRPTPSSGSIAVASSLVANPVATQLYRFAVVFPSPWVVPAGAQWLIFAESDAAGAGHQPMIRTLVQLLDGSR